MADLKYSRLLVKFSGESVAGEEGIGIDPKILDSMAVSIKLCKELGAEIGIVIGGGNLFRGERLSQSGMDRVAGDHMGMLATVMNGSAEVANEASPDEEKEVKSDVPEEEPKEEKAEESEKGES